MEAATRTTMRRSFSKTRSDEIMTYSGVVVRPLEPEPNLIVIEDIAHATANVCRFTGHVREFYSVAQHSVHVADLLWKRHHDTYLSLWGLLHDASEAYLSDLAKPIKSQEGLGEIYRDAENTLTEAIIERFGLTPKTLPMPEEVAWADYVMLRAEQRDLMPGTYDVEEADEWWPNAIEPWLPDRAERVLLERFNEWI